MTTVYKIVRRDGLRLKPLNPRWTDEYEVDVLPIRVLPVYAYGTEAAARADLAGIRRAGLDVALLRCEADVLANHPTFVNVTDPANPRRTIRVPTILHYKELEKPDVLLRLAAFWRGEPSNTIVAGRGTVVCTSLKPVERL